MKFADHRGGSTLKCADLGQKEWLVQIESIREEEVGEERERKLVARFEGRSKSLPLNDTNLEKLEVAFGPDSDDAIGGQVILYVDPDVRYGGKRVGGIRIKLPKVKEKAASKTSTAEYLNDKLPDDDNSSW